MSRSLIVAGCLIALVGLVQPALADILPATAASSGSMDTFGTPVSLTLPSGNYADIGTQVTGQTIVGQGGGALLYTWATVTGTNPGAPENITMAWRARTLHESFPWEPNAAPTDPPLHMPGVLGLPSDVLQMTGIPAGQIYVLQMSYDPTLFDEKEEAAIGCLHIDWLNPTTGMWENAIYGNSNNSSSLYNVQKSWEAAGEPVTLGEWGVDTTTHIAWAVVDHNSEFAVQPEPGTLALLAVGAVLAGLRKRARGK